MSVGMLGYLAVGVESSAGTAAGSVAVCDYVYITDEKLSINVNPLYDAGIGAQWDQLKVYNGLQSVGGSVSMQAHPYQMGYFLYSLFGSTSVSVGSAGATEWYNLVDSDALFRVHRFAGLQTQFQAGSGSDLPGLTLEVYRGPSLGSGSAFVYYNCAANTGEFTIQAGQLMTCTFDFLGRDYSRKAKSTPSYSVPQAFLWSQCSVSVAGVGSAIFESMTIRVDNKLVSVPFLDQRLRPGLIKRNDFRTVEANGSISFQGDTDYDIFTAGSERSVILSLMTSTSEKIEFDMPSFRYVTFTGPNINGPGRITIPFQGRAVYNPGSGMAMQVSMANKRANNYSVNSNN